MEAAKLQTLTYRLGSETLAKRWAAQVDEAQAPVDGENDETPRDAAGRRVFNLRGPIEDSEFWAAWLDGCTPKQLEGFLADAGGEDVVIRVNSPGGSYFGGGEMRSALAGYSGNVRVEVTGMAASAASIVMCGGDEVLVSDGAAVMVHAPWIIAAGNAEQLEAEAAVLRKLTKGAAKTYARAVGNRGKDEDAVEGWLSGDDEWFTADEAIDAGLADANLDDEAKPARAQADLFGDAAGVVKPRQRVKAARAGSADDGAPSEAVPADEPAAPQADDDATATPGEDVPPDPGQPPTDNGEGDEPEPEAEPEADETSEADEDADDDDDDEEEILDVLDVVVDRGTLGSATMGRAFRISP